MTELSNGTVPCEKQGESQPLGLIHTTMGVGL